MINLLGYLAFEKPKRPHTWYLLREGQEPDYILSDDLMLHYIEIPRFNSQIQQPDSTARFNSQNQLSPHLTHWLNYLQKEGKTTEENMEILLKNEPILEKAYKHYPYFTGNNEYREAYEAKQEWLHDTASRLAAAREEGMERDIEKGIEKGAHRKALETAQKFLKMGLSTQQVMEGTGLSREEIEDLQGL